MVSKVLYKRLPLTPPRLLENGAETANAAIKRVIASRAEQKGLQKL